MNPTDIVRVELFRNTVLLGVCVIVFAVISVRFAKRDKHLSGKRALALAAVPIFLQLLRDVLSRNAFLEFGLPLAVAVALGYSLVALVRCCQRTGAAVAVTLALLETLLIPTVMVDELGMLISGFG